MPDPFFLVDLGGIPPAALAAFQATSAEKGPPDLPPSADSVCSLLVRFPPRSLSIIRKGPLHKVVNLFLVDLGGIEPPSENPSHMVSPITVTVLSFPPSAVQRQTAKFSSFIILHTLQSLSVLVFRLIRCRIPGRRICAGPTAAIKQRVLIFHQRLYLDSRF